MSAGTKYTVKGGFSFGNIIATESLAEWHRKETEKNLKEKDPVLRAFNTIKIKVNGNILPANPLSAQDMEEIDKFPFAQINDLAPPGKDMAAVLQIQQKLMEENKGKTLDTELSAQEKEMVGKMFGLGGSQAADLIRYLKGEVKTI